MKKQVTTALTTLSLVAASAGTALAQSAPQITVERNEAIRILDVGRLISSLIGAAIVLSALMVLGYLILGGIQWITSGGDKGKTEQARSKITAAIIGLAIVASAFAIMQIISFFFGVNIFGSGLQDTISNIKPY